ncbi:hypothetical protein [Streptomyces sp. KL116D]|uniref:hypothetical protein n=1 Tax=Streptomyces sp. KL116D TaxID=3045152 RepID=UPI0035575A21
MKKPIPFVTMLVSALLLAVVGSTTATASATATARTARAGYVAQAQAAGLSAGQATALQAKVDDYLVTFDGQGTQVSPNQVDLDGAVLNVTVPGENRPRPLGDQSAQVYNAYDCTGWTNYGWFCAYKYENRSGDNIGMYACAKYAIPWVTVGSWVNNQLTGTEPMMYYSNHGSELLPPAYSSRSKGVKWRDVTQIRNCV